MDAEVIKDIEFKNTIVFKKGDIIFIEKSDVSDYKAKFKYFKDEDAYISFPKECVRILK